TADEVAVTLVIGGDRDGRVTRGDTLLGDTAAAVPPDDARDGHLIGGHFEIGQRHSLANLTIMDERGVITAAGPFQGLDRFEARPAIVAALREQGRIV